MANEQNLPEKLIWELLALFKCRNELKNLSKELNYYTNRTLNECLEECLDCNKHIDLESILKIDSIIDTIDDNLNIGHWSEISVGLRRTYTLASYIKVIFYLRYHKLNIKLEILREALKYVDKGLLMGAPLEKNHELLTDTATTLSHHIKRYLDKNIFPLEAGDAHIAKQYEFLYHSIKANEIVEQVLPSLQQFNNLYFVTQHPVKLKGCINHWPARKKWKNLEYLLEICGDRTVPVEIGTQYVDENWCQKLMTVRQFIDKYYLNRGENIGYLAQHNLLDQIPELREDICIPEYCCLSRDYEKSSDPDINCWFGPAGTVSSLHYDPKNNFLVQVFGTKQILLFPPQDTQHLYPYEGTMLSNTSQVDPLMPNLELYPNFKNASMYKCLLREGEMLFIPEKWWHHVVALDRSFSLSFWWQ